MQQVQFVSCSRYSTRVPQKHVQEVELVAEHDLMRGRKRRNLCAIRAVGIPAGRSRLKLYMPRCPTEQPGTRQPRTALTGILRLDLQTPKGINILSELSVARRVAVIEQKRDYGAGVAVIEQKRERGSGRRQPCQSAGPRDTIAKGYALRADCGYSRAPAHVF